MVIFLSIFIFSTVNNEQEWCKSTMYLLHLIFIFWFCKLLKKVHPWTSLEILAIWLDNKPQHSLLLGLLEPDHLLQILVFTWLSYFGLNFSNNGGQLLIKKTTSATLLWCSTLGWLLVMGRLVGLFGQDKPTWQLPGWFGQKAIIYKGCHRGIGGQV